MGARRSHIYKSMLVAFVAGLLTLLQGAAQLPPSHCALTLQRWYVEKEHLLCEQLRLSDEKMVEFLFIYREYCSDLIVIDQKMFRLQEAMFCQGEAVQDDSLKKIAARLMKHQKHVTRLRKRYFKMVCTRFGTEVAVTFIQNDLLMHSLFQQRYFAALPEERM